MPGGGTPRLPLRALWSGAKRSFPGSRLASYCRLIGPLSRVPAWQELSALRHPSPTRRASFHSGEDPIAPAKICSQRDPKRMLRRPTPLRPPVLLPPFRLCEKAQIPSVSSTRGPGRDRIGDLFSMAKGLLSRWPCPGHLVRGHAWGSAWPCPQHHSYYWQ